MISSTPCHNVEKGLMKNQNPRLDEIEKKQERLRHTLEGLIPIWTQVDRRVKTLQFNIETLEKEAQLIKEGQTEMQFNDLDF